jgi:hypothetical protein
MKKFTLATIALALGTSLIAAPQADSSKAPAQPTANKSEKKPKKEKKPKTEHKADHKTDAKTDKSKTK